MCEPPSRRSGLRRSNRLLFVFDFTEEFDTELEMESRPIQTETTAQDETSRTIFRRYPINVPVPVGEIATVYFLGETDKERRML